MICMIRHGQTNQNKLKKIQGQSDFPLNEFGFEQARLAGKFIKQNYKFDVIISSPLSRAIQTANQIKNEIGFDKEIIIENGFIERAFGNAEGKDICPEVFNDIYKDNVEGLEKSCDLQVRVYEAMKKVVEKYKDLNVLIVTHSHTIKGMLTYLDTNRSFMDRLDNCCLNIFEYENDKLKIIESNIIPF